MKKTHIAAAIAGLFASAGAAFAAVMPAQKSRGKFLGRRRFQDAGESVFTFRMPGLVPGEAGRFHPTGVEPCLIDVTAPPLQYGIPGLINAANNGFRPYTVADASDATDSDPWGFNVRPFPTQQQSGNLTASFGAGAPPVSGEVDVMRQGYIGAFLAAGGAVVKGGRVYVWCAASTGAHVQGGVEAAASAGNTVKLGARWTFNGPSDQYGNVEICCNV